MSFTSFEEIVRFAMDKEKEAVDFYSGLAKNTVFSGAREILEGFADEEQKHYDMLEDLGKAEKRLADYKFEWIPISRGVTTWWIWMIQKIWVMRIFSDWP